jgi:hypothetical protein
MAIRDAFKQAPELEVTIPAKRSPRVVLFRKG